MDNYLKADQSEDGTWYLDYTCNKGDLAFIIALIQKELLEHLKDEDMTGYNPTESYIR